MKTGIIATTLQHKRAWHLFLHLSRSSKQNVYTIQNFYELRFRREFAQKIASRSCLSNFLQCLRCCLSRQKNEFEDNDGRNISDFESILLCKYKRVIGIPSACFALSANPLVNGILLQLQKSTKSKVENIMERRDWLFQSLKDQYFYSHVFQYFFIFPVLRCT